MFDAAAALIALESPEAEVASGSVVVTASAADFVALAGYLVRLN